MSMKMGRPPSDNPKTKQITIRLDEEGNQLLNQCCEKTNQTKSQVLRKGLDLYSQQIIKKWIKEENRPSDQRM